MERQIASSLLSIGAVFLRPEQPFTWASGIKSPVYCDNRLTLTAPEVRNDVEEALLLGDRILVMENGNIKADMPVNLPTPRKAADSELQKMRQQILDLLAE